MYYLKVIVLENCAYSIAARELLKSQNIKHKLVIVSQNEKNKFKTDNINTFPQVYLNKKHTKGNLLLGGFNDLNNAFIEFKSQKISDNKINEFMKKYSWEKKSTLRLIQLFNKV